jgi:hypothetical protein
VSLPTADDLFRPTVERHGADPTPTPPEERALRAEQGPEPAESPRASEEHGEHPEHGESHGRVRRARRSSGRVRHDEKMTVYVTADELLELEHARLLLRRDHELAVDRGRLVREAVALALADLEAHGEQSAIVQRLKHA